MTGLLKKACEISLLCGVEVAVSFTDLKGNLHSYKNSSNFSIKPKKRIFEMKDKIVIDYKSEDYPFERKFLTEKRKKIKMEQEEFKMLGKRNFNSRENYEEKLKDDLSKFDKILKKDSSSQSTESKEDSCEFQERSQMVNRSLTLLYKPQYQPQNVLQASEISSMSTKIFLKILTLLSSTPSTSKKIINHNSSRPNSLQMD